MSNDGIGRWAPSLDGNQRPNMELLDFTLFQNQANIDLRNLDLSGIPVLHIYGHFRVVDGGEGNGVDHIRMTINDDVTQQHYAWGVWNDNGSSAVSAYTVGDNTNNTSSASIMASHATTNTGLANQYGHTHITIPFPGSNDRTKSMTMIWAMCDTSFNPTDNFGTFGHAYWASTNPITSLKFFATNNSVLAAGSRVTLLG